jgi:T5orf172 domain
MSPRIQTNDPSPTVPSRGRAFVYVLPCRYEDILKIGFSRDPLDRLQDLHRRYFEFFDLDRAFLIETDHVRDARRLESALANAVAEHRAPSPLVIRRSAAGHTEWYRGAHEQVSNAWKTLSPNLGYKQHAPLTPWLRDRLLERSDILFEWSSRALNEIEVAAAEGSAHASDITHVLRAALDAYCAVGLPVEAYVPAEVIEWWRKGL